MKNISFLLILLIMLMGNLYATNYYVDFDGGHDTSSGTSITNAWKTISQVNLYGSEVGFHAGDIISFKCGARWTGETLFPSSDSLTFNSYGTGERPVIDRNADTSLNDLTQRCVFIDSLNNISFYGITFVHGEYENVFLYKCNYITFDHCNIDASSHGYTTDAAPGQLLTELGSHFTARYCTFNYSAGGHGIYINATSNSLLEFDTIQYNRAQGINIGYDSLAPFLADSLTVRYCVIKQNMDGQIYDDGCQHSSFYYNVIENSTVTGFQYSAGIHIVDQGYAPNGNNYFNNTIVIHQQGIVFEIGADPGYINQPNITNMTVKNNIINVSSSSCWSWYIRGTRGTWTIDNNLYYVMSGGYESNWFLSGTPDTNFGIWQYSGFDTHGKVVNPQFTNDDSIYTLQNSSPAVLAGVWLNLNPAQDITGKPIGNPPDIGAYQNASYLSGTIPSSTLSGNIAVTADVISPTGTTLTISPGAKLRFATGCSLTINGQCNAVGSTSPITFTSLSGSTNDSWGSIIFDGYNDYNTVLIDNAIISNALKGIQCLNESQVVISNSQFNNCNDGIYIYNAMPTISNNSFDSPGNCGINFEVQGTSTVEGNSFTNTANIFGTYGIFVNAGDITLEVFNNYIHGLWAGGVFSGAYVETGEDQGSYCNNNITGNLYGIWTCYGGYVLLGGYCGGSGETSPYNSINDNSHCDLWTWEESIVQGGPNYYGDNPNFYVDESSINDLESYGFLTSNHCSSNNSIKGNVIANNTLKKSSSENLLQGNLFETQGKIDDAIAFYLELIKNNNHVRTALVKLAYIKNKYSRPEITTLLENLLNSSNSNYSKIQNLLGNIYMHDKRFDDAIAAFNEVIIHSSNDYDGINARFEKLLGYFHIKKNVQVASQILSDIKGMHLTDQIYLKRIKSTEELLENAKYRTTYKLASGIPNAPNSYELLQNYPNPFNPSTTIKYQIPKPGLVTLKVYDIIGREVTTLVNENKIEGFYTVKFNASRFPSGVYIYQLRINDFVSSKKMLLLK